MMFVPTPEEARVLRRHLRMLEGEYLSAVTYHQLARARQIYGMCRRYRRAILLSEEFHPAPSRVLVDAGHSVN
ncbi:MAG: hypothetical protein HYX89_06140 [Chloroflexi bacterium]|nr:hypothetical protein [Chloroflexota bacterium]